MNKTNVKVFETFLHELLLKDKTLVLLKIFAYCLN